MEYYNMKLNELEKEAYNNYNRLALELIERYEQLIEDCKEEVSILTSSQSYDEGWDDAVEEMTRKLRSL